MKIVIPIVLILLISFNSMCQEDIDSLNVVDTSWYDVKQDSTVRGVISFVLMSILTIFIVKHYQENK